MSGTILERHFDDFHDRLLPLIKASDFDAAHSLCTSYIDIADRANDAEAAAMFVGFLATVLIMAQRPSEALEAYERAERYEPTVPRHKIQTASHLTWSLARPHEALIKLAEAEPLLPGSRDESSWHNEHGVAALAVGKHEDAIKSMQALAEPRFLAGIRHAMSLHYQVDLRLVTRMVEKRLAPAACIAYLEAAEALGEKSGEPADEAPLRTVRELLEQLRAGA